MAIARKEQYEYLFPSSYNNLAIPMNGLIQALRSDVLERMSALRASLVKDAELESNEVTKPEYKPHF